MTGCGPQVWPEYALVAGPVWLQPLEAVQQILGPRGLRCAELHGQHHQLIAATERVIDDLSSAHTGSLFAMPISRIVGSQRSRIKW
jgi:hypothetical protein